MGKYYINYHVYKIGENFDGTLEQAVERATHQLKNLWCAIENISIYDRDDDMRTVAYIRMHRRKPTEQDEIFYIPEPYDRADSNYEHWDQKLEHWWEPWTILGNKESEENNESQKS